MRKPKKKLTTIPIQPANDTPEEITGDFGEELHLGTWTEEEILDHYACDMNEDWD